MMIKNFAALLMSTMIVGACAAPEVESSNTRSSQASTVSVINAPDGAILSAGGREAYVSKGTATLALPDGWHDVELRYAGERKTQRIFVQDGTKKILNYQNF